jgi:hypothetical protein
MGKFRRRGKDAMLAEDGLQIGVDDGLRHAHSVSDHTIVPSGFGATTT